MDAYSRKVMGYALCETLEATGPLEALKMAVGQRRRLSSFILIHRSDRGVQYCCSEYIDMLRTENIAISMTHNGSPYENALAERSNGTVKNEFPSDKVYPNHQEAKKAIAQAVKVYNEKRPHASVDYLTPEQAHWKEGPLKRRWKSYSKQPKQKEGSMKVEA